MTVDTRTQLPRIFIGAPLENRSEHDCLRIVYEALTKLTGWRYIFANFHAAGRQIDLAVFTATTTLVIEAKSYSQPVHGGINGGWQQLGPYGVKKTRNAYDQALQAKNALRDEIQRHNQIAGYPNAVVAITPAIPEGSALTPGDFKVAVVDLGQLEAWLSVPSGALLTQQFCEALAKHIGLEEIAEIAAALDEQVLIAERMCGAYLEAFKNLHNPVALEMVDDRYKHSDLEIGRSEVQAMIVEGTTSVVLSGPSGCGKTLLTTSCAVACAENGAIPIFVSAKDFEGNFQRLLDQEAALLNGHQAKNIVNAGKILGKRTVLFLDGYNECRDELKIRLTRGLRAFALRYSAGIVISTQQEIIRADLLTSKSVLIERPSDDLKKRLAGIKSDEANPNASNLLQVATSGLEATLVGAVGALLPRGTSRFSLFDMYARKRLSTAAVEGIRVLSLFAQVLVDRACFSLSVREFDRLCDSANLDRLSRQRIDASQLLKVRGDRVSFIHELHFAAFSAEAVIRLAKDDVTQILTALASPRLFSSRIFILGAIEDERLLYQVLEKLNSQDLLAACSRGDCGFTAQMAVRAKIERALTAMIAEAREIRFEIIDEGWNGIGIAEDSLRTELNEFGSLVAAIGDGLLDGRYLDDVLTACEYMDTTIAAFSRDHVTEAKAKKIPLRHELFSAAYVLRRDTAISKLVESIHNGTLSLHRLHGHEKLHDVAMDAWQRAETPGQFYVLIALTKFSDHRTMLAPHIAQLLENVKSYPYHLQLELIDCATYLRDASEPDRNRIVTALETLLNQINPLMNSIVFEALRGLGALDEREQDHIHVVHEEIRRVLATDGSESDIAAWRLFSCQFDHPFDSAYWEEIQGLDETVRKTILTKACRGADAPHVFFLGMLIRQLSEFGDPDVASAIVPWTALPDVRSFSPQDALEVFVGAHEALGHLGVTLSRPEPKTATAAESALLACGELCYWASRADIENLETSARTNGARTTLLDHAKGASAGALLLTSSRLLARDGARVSLVNTYPRVCLAVCREALRRRHEQISYFQHGFHANTDDIARFAIQVLGKQGDDSDLQTLRDLCDDQGYGVSSLDAIRRIEARTRFTD